MLALKRPVESEQGLAASTTTRRFRYIPRLPPVARPAGRARHSVRAADSNLFSERRARSDAPYLTRYRNFFVTVLAGDRIGTFRNFVRFCAPSLFSLLPPVQSLEYLRGKERLTCWLLKPLLRD